MCYGDYALLYNWSLWPSMDIKALLIFWLETQYKLTIKQSLFFWLKYKTKFIHAQNWNQDYNPWKSAFPSYENPAGIYTLKRTLNLTTQEEGNKLLSLVSETFKKKDENNQIQY